MPWEEAVTRRVASGITRARKARGWNVPRLSDECANRTGVKVSRGSIAKLESGERKVITVPEWLALSFALDIPPVSLLYDFTGSVEFDLVPAAVVDGPTAAGWITADAPGPPITKGTVDAEVEAHSSWRRAKAPVQLMRRHQAAVLGFWRVREAADRLRPGDIGLLEQLPMAPLSGDEGYWRTWVEEQSSGFLFELRSVREELRTNSWPLPPLPRAVAEALAEMEEG